MSARTYYLASVLILTLVTAAAFGIGYTVGGCTTDTECAALCAHDDAECDGGPQS